MRLLILTQKVDKSDPILGFFHAWIEGFAKHAERVTVICLCEGQHSLPNNVQIFSLGKEDGVSKLKYICRFYAYMWRFRRDYDAVFVHMNQEYVLLGGLLWRLFNKKVLMWRNHPVGGFLTGIAILFSNRVFMTSESAYVARYKKSKIMPVGINTRLFKRKQNVSRNIKEILYVGRVEPIKKIDVLIRALLILNDDGLDFKCHIYGPHREEEYYNYLLGKSKSIMDTGKLIFEGAVSNEKMVDVYNKYEVSINMTENGSFDKAILEHMACGGLVIFSNDVLKKQISKSTYQLLSFEYNDPVSLAIKIKRLLALDTSRKDYLSNELNKVVKKHHSLEFLVKNIYNELAQEQN